MLIIKKYSYIASQTQGRDRSLNTCGSFTENIMVAHNSYSFVSLGGLVCVCLYCTLPLHLL